MAKGAEAKAYATEKIKEIFGENFIGEYEKKLYVNCPEAGGMIQVAIALTCPKIPINAGMAVNIPSTKNGGMDFENMMNIQTSSVELTQNEKDNIKKLLEIVS